MIRSESIIKIAPALLKAQKEIGSAVKGSTNPFYKSAYADLGSVMEACKDKLNENGISVLQPVGTDEGGVYVETILLHESGEFISDKMRLSVKEDNNPQAQGSAITYARRYSLQSMVFIPAEDDDGERATQPTRTATSKVEPVTDDLIATCKVHNLTMKQYSGEHGEFWSHAREVNGVKDWCYGKGYASDLRAKA